MFYLRRVSNDKYIQNDNSADNIKVSARSFSCYDGAFEAQCIFNAQCVFRNHEVYVSIEED